MENLSGFHGFKYQTKIQKERRKDVEKTVKKKQSKGDQIIQLKKDHLLFFTQIQHKPINLLTNHSQIT